MGVIADMIAADRSVEIARNLLMTGADVEYVQKMTYLDEATVLELRDEIAREETQI